VAVVLDNEVTTNFEQAWRGDKSCADIAVRIEIIPCVYTRREMHRLIAENITIARGMGGEHQHHRNRMRALKCDVVACPDLHKNLLDCVGVWQAYRGPIVPGLTEQIMGVSSHVGLTLHVLPGVRHSAALLRAIWVIAALTAVSTMQSVIAAVDTHLGGRCDGDIKI
jgi:hypothetical protein